MPTRVTVLPERVDESVDRRVRAAATQQRRSLQEALARDCALVLHFGGKVVAVPATIELGWPSALGGLELPDDYDVLGVCFYSATLVNDEFGPTGRLRQRALDGERFHDLPGAGVAA
jgi:hypothetical protein